MNSHLLYIAELLRQLEISDPARFQHSAVVITNHLEAALARKQRGEPLVLDPFRTRRTASGRRN